MKKSGVFWPFIFVYIIFALMLFANNVNQIPNDVEFAGVFLFLSAILISILVFLATAAGLFLSIQVFSKTKFITPLIIGILLIGLYATHLTTFNICVFEKRDNSPESIISKQSKEREKVIRSGKTILLKSDNIFPEKREINKDSLIIVDFIQKYLDSCLMPLKLPEAKKVNSNFLHFFHLILSDSSRSENDSLLILSIKKSISLDYIAYSPDEKFIITMLTYSYSENRVGILFLLGERNDTKLELYKRDCNFDGDIFIDKEYAFYKFFTDIKSVYKGYGCGCDVSSKSFWECSNFEKVSIKPNYVNRFKILNKYDNQLKIYKDTIAMSFLISKTK